MIEPLIMATVVNSPSVGTSDGEWRCEDSEEGCTDEVIGIENGEEQHELLSYQAMAHESNTNQARQLVNTDKKVLPQLHGREYTKIPLSLTQFVGFVEFVRYIGCTRHVPMQCRVQQCFTVSCVQGNCNRFKHSI